MLTTITSHCEQPTSVSVHLSNPLALSQSFFSRGITSSSCSALHQLRSCPHPARGLGLDDEPRVPAAGSGVGAVVLANDTDRDTDLRKPVAVQRSGLVEFDPVGDPDECKVVTG